MWSHVHFGTSFPVDEQPFLQLRVFILMFFSRYEDMLVLLSAMTAGDLEHSKTGAILRWGKEQDVACRCSLSCSEQGHECKTDPRK